MLKITSKETITLSSCSKKYLLISQSTLCCTSGIRCMKVVDKRTPPPNDSSVITTLLLDFISPASVALSHLNFFVTSIGTNPHTMEDVNNTAIDIPFATRTPSVSSFSWKAWTDMFDSFGVRSVKKKTNSGWNPGLVPFYTRLALCSINTCAGEYRRERTTHARRWTRRRTGAACCTRRWSLLQSTRQIQVRR